jgi:hypothetical protein
MLIWEENKPNWAVVQFTKKTAWERNVSLCQGFLPTLILILSGNLSGLSCSVSAVDVATIPSLLNAPASASAAALNSSDLLGANSMFIVTVIVVTAGTETCIVV